MTDPTALLEAAKREAHAAVEQLGFPYLLDSRHPKKLIEDAKASIDRALRIAERVGGLQALERLPSSTFQEERDRLLAELERE